ncbi:MAG TPA: ribosomal protein S5-alanine N-acetyltransferase [Luteibacter sp.]|jgi:ribosomal-protein-alanine N-acetyltransferase|nr:ribosomal protein S5-alanine N-acetyltransferase [Luteibacter sp.]
MYPPTRLRTSRTVVRLLRADEAGLLLRYRDENREHLDPWEPLREPSYYTHAACQDTLAAALEAARGDRAYPFAVLTPGEDEMLGSANLANIVRGIFQACHLGYGVAARHQGKGLMHEALEALIGHAFGPLGLHRVMANYMPRNERSGRLLERLGFEREGQAKRYLKIAGVWEDHILTAKINPLG